MTHQTNCSLSMTSYDIWNEQTNAQMDDENNEKQDKIPNLDQQFTSFKETVNNFLSDDLTQLTITSHIDKLNSSFNKIIEENEAISSASKSENILEDIDENLKLFKQSPNISTNNLVQINTQNQSILNAINLEKRNSLLLNQPPDIAPVVLKETEDTNFEETNTDNFTYTDKNEDKNVSEIDMTQDRENDFTYISVNNADEILEKVEAVPLEIVGEVQNESCVQMTETANEPDNEPVKSFITSKEMVENEFKEFKTLEPVKKLKKLWESQILPNFESTHPKKNKHSFNSNDIKPERKWSSMQSINQKEKTSSRNSSSSDCSKADDARSNMNIVLDEIKRYDFSRSQSLDKFDEITKNKKAASNESLHCCGLETSRLVEKLKHKFDNKDHCFTKIASLTCRNVLNKEQSSFKSSSPARPMLSVYEQQIDDLKDKPKVSRLIKSESANNIQSMCSSPLSANQSFNNSYKLLGNGNSNETKLRKANSLSTYSISSSIGTRSSSSASESASMTSSLTHRNNVITSQQSFNKEIKGLLDIAENRTKLLCKVYDSSLNEVEAVPVREEIVIKRPIIMHKNRYSVQSQLNENSLRINDYRGIINSNYLKSNKKQSNVIQKVKMWDQMVETGRLMTDKWDTDFIQN